MRTSLRLLLVPLLSLLGACSESSTAPVSVATVVITPATQTLASGAKVQLTAAILDEKRRTLDPRAIEWWSANPEVATVSDDGEVTAGQNRGATPSTAVITATVDGRVGTATITVTPAPVAQVVVTPATVTLAAGGTRTLVAELRDALGNTLSGRTVTWSTSDATVATVNASGLLTAVAYLGTATRTATITATSEGRTGSAVITVTPAAVGSVTVVPGSATIQVGATQTLVAVLASAEGALLLGRPVTWSSSATSVATVSDAGVVTAVAPGTATITATSEGKTGTATITVTAVFLRAANGVTVVCPNAAVGASGSVGGVVYTKRTRAQLDSLLTAGNPAALSSSCTSGVTNMSELFRNNGTFNEDISTWDVTAVTSMASMFDNATAFNSPIGAWDVSNVTDMGFMFYRAPAFNQPIGAWKVGKVTRTLQMFDGASAFNQDVGGWDVRAVTNMNFMFYAAAAFNRDLSGWCVSQFPTKPNGFDSFASAWVLPKPVWGTCPAGLRIGDGM